MISSVEGNNSSSEFQNSELTNLQRLCSESYSDTVIIGGPFEKFVDSPYYSESELCGGAVMVSFSKYLLWQEMHFLQRSTHFSKTCCRPFASSFMRIMEQAVLTT